MNSQTIIMCIFALLLGMPMFHMLKDVCGCKVVEGMVETRIQYEIQNYLKQDHYRFFNSFIDELKENNISDKNIMIFKKLYDIEKSGDDYPDNIKLNMTEKQLRLVAKIFKKIFYR